MTAHVTPLPVAGSVVGGLVVLDELGRGAQNVIYRARRELASTIAAQGRRRPRLGPQPG